MLEGEKHEGKWFPIGSYTKKHKITMGIRKTKQCP
jgi:hypothetical protein